MTSNPATDPTSKIVLVTGANKGIGYATVRHVATAGHTALLGARDPERGANAVAALAADGVPARYVALDVTDAASVEAAAALVERDYGRLDVLVNNAGISRDRDFPLTGMPATALREVFDTNVFGVVTTTNAMLPLLRRSPGAVIGNVSSGLGTVPVLSGADDELAAYARLLAYNSSKAALNAITMMYAAELAPDGITVNGLSPGYCATDLNGYRGVLSADEGGAYLAEQIFRTDAPSGVFLNERGGTYPW